jgi:DNA polymerase-1
VSAYRGKIEMSFIMLIDFNIKEKIKELKRANKKIPAEYFDLSVAFWMLNPDEEQYSSEFLSKRYLHKEGASNKELYNYAAKKLKEYKLEKLFYEVEMPLVAVLADMELRGIKVDIKGLKNLDKELEKKLAELAKDIYKEAGEIFNINSPKQLSRILFEKLNMSTQGIKKTKSGAVSTNVDTLMAIQDRHPIAKHLLEYRELFKLQSTYVRPLQELADKHQRIHTTYIQTGTSTGRLSSQNPNLQNIPVEGEWAKKIRASFVPEKGHQLAAFDYSQIELRILASLSGDPKMIEAFNNDLDIHKMTAASVFNVSIEKVTPEMRRLAKTLNFGVVYGMGAIAFAKTSGLSVGEAKKFIEEYFRDFKKVKEWQEEIKSQARTFGYVTNLNGRRRWLLSAASMFRGEAAEAERAAINMPVQGLAADIIKVAMVKVAGEIKKRGWGQSVRMLLTIHDELLFEIREDIIEEVSMAIVKIMEGAYELEVPIKVTAKIGKNWGNLQ